MSLFNFFNKLSYFNNISLEFTIDSNTQAEISSRLLQQKQQIIPLSFSMENVANHSLPQNILLSDEDTSNKLLRNTNLKTEEPVDDEQLRKIIDRFIDEEVRLFPLNF